MMEKANRRCLLVSLVMVSLSVVVASCAQTSPKSPIAKAGPGYLLLSPASLGRSLSLSQLVVGEYDDKKYQMRFEVEITPERLVIVGVSPLGVNLFSLVQENGRKPVISQLEGPAPFDPRHILFDVYLTYWPLGALQAALSPLSMRMTESADGAVRKAQDSDGKVIAEVTFPFPPKKYSRIDIRHFDFPYRLTIRTL